MLHTTLLRGQPLAFEHPNDPTNFLRGNIQALLQDQQGFIWVGSTNGLGRYDGEHIREFRQQSNDSLSLTSNVITCLAEDTTGRIWIGTNRGLNCYDPRRDVIVQHPLFLGQDTILDYVRTILVDRKGDIWYTTIDYGLVKLSLNKYRHEQLSPGDQTEASSTAHTNIYDLFEDAQGTLWLGTLGGLYYLSSEEPYTVEPFNQLLPEINPYPKERVFQIRAQDSVTYWLGTYNGLYRMRTDTNLSFTHYEHQPTLANSLSYNFVEDLLVTNDRVWVATFDGGLNEVVLPEKTSDSLQFIRHQHQPADATSISANRVNVLLEDRTGILWVGTSRGLDKYASRNQRFTHVQPIANDTTSLSSRIVSCFARDRRGDLWVGTDQGLHYLSAKDFADRRFHFQRIQAGPEISSAYLTSNRIEHLLVDSNDILWISTYLAPNFIDLNSFHEHPKFRFIGTTNKGSPHGIPHTWVFLMEEIRKHQFWIGTYDGLVRMTFNPRDAIPVFMDNFQAHDHPDSLLMDNITAIGEDRFGEYWIGTHGGINRFLDDQGQRSFQSYQLEPGKENSLSNNTVTTLHLDQKERFWVGTRNGLNLMLQTAPGAPVTFRRFGKLEGLAGVFVTSINEDWQGNLWLGTPRGLYHFDPERAINGHNGVLQVYNQQNGLPGSTILNAYQDSVGNIFLATDNGFVFFNPRHIVKNERAPKVVFTDFWVGDQAVPLAAVGRMSAEGQRAEQAAYVKLPHHQNDLTARFAALDFANPYTNRYRYQLLGYDTTWHDNGTTNKVSFTNLAPGDYELRIQGTNGDGVWSERPAVLALTIIPPWWQRWWAYGIYAAIFLGVLYGYVHFKIREGIRVVETQAKLAAVRVEERERLRKKNAADFHDELGHRLTKVALFLALAERETPPTSSLGQLLRKMKTHMSSVTDGIRDLIWSLDPQKDSLEQTVLRLQEFGDQLFEYTEVQFSTQIAKGNLSDIALAPDTRKQILLLFKEAMNNTVKYAGANKAVFTAVQVNNEVSLTFTDDGCGFSPLAPPSGYGIKNMRKRAQDMGATLLIDSAPSKGTVISLRWVVI